MYCGKFFLVIFLIVSQSIIWAQELDSSSLVSYIPGNDPDEVEIYSAVSPIVEESVRDIIIVKGLEPSSFVVRESNVPNVAAFRHKGIRYILYDADFISSLEDSKWAMITVLSHVIAIHLLDYSNSNVRYDREARQKVELFVGSVIARLGGEAADARIVISSRFDDIEIRQRGWFEFKGGNFDDELSIITFSRYLTERTYITLEGSFGQASKFSVGAIDYFGDNDNLGFSYPRFGFYTKLDIAGYLKYRHQDIYLGEVGIGLNYTPLSYWTNRLGPVMGADYRFSSIYFGLELASELFIPEQDYSIYAEAGYRIPLPDNKIFDDGFRGFYFGLGISYRLPVKLFGANANISKK